MRRNILLSSFALSLIVLSSASVLADSTVSVKPPASKKLSSTLEQGRYLVRIAGCNDCHTAGYAPSGGKTPEARWLQGDHVGFRGPWGTTYPANLRLLVKSMTEAQWVKMAHTAEMRPPMPWFALRDMKVSDLRAIYRYLRHLGPAGNPAPAFVPPNQEPTTPYIVFVPQPPAPKSAMANRAP